MQAAKLQGADILTSLDNMKFSMEVTYTYNADSGEACGTNVQFPAGAVTLDPSLPLKLTTINTRVEPEVTFECAPGKTYHLILNDSLGGAFQATRAYNHDNHWMKLNMVCPSSGMTIAMV